MFTLQIAINEIIMLERIKQVSEAARMLPHGHGRYSQLGEDVILKYIHEQLGEGDYKNVYTFFDIGASDGKSMSNSFLFRELGWRVYAFDGNYENDLVKKVFFNSGNAYKIIKDENMFGADILSIDVDGQDYWILKNIIEKGGIISKAQDQPDIICLEINGCIQQETPQAVPLDDNFKHDGTDYYGANLPAFKQLLTDYTLVFHHHSQNAFFVHKSFGCPEFTEPVERMQYHPHSPGREWINL